MKFTMNIGNSQVSTSKIAQIKKQPSKTISHLLEEKENILVVFDVDGTLFKAREIFLPAIRTVLSENNINDISDANCMKLVGMPYDKIEVELKKLKIKTTYKDFKLRLQQLEMENIRHSGKLFKGVINILKKLSQENYTLAICTNAREKYISIIVEKFNLTRYFKSENIYFPDKFSQPANKISMPESEFPNRERP